MNKLEYIPGDIVKIEYGEATGKIGFVTNTFLRRKGCYSLVVFIGKGFQGSSKDDWIQTYNDEVSPIPITTEILEKNGWVKKVMSRGIKNSHWVYTKPDIEEYGYFPIYIEKGIGDEFDVYPFTDNNVCKPIAYIKYVHQLQHLLFGLGLNSEMEVGMNKQKCKHQINNGWCKARGSGCIWSEYTPESCLKREEV